MPKTREDFRDSEIANLIESARAGNSVSVAALLQAYQEHLTHLATLQFRRQLKPRVSPSDVVQDTLFGAHQNFNQFRGQSESELMAWLRTILISKLFKSVGRHIQAAQRDVRKEIALDNPSQDNPNASREQLRNRLPAREPTPSVNLQKQESISELEGQLSRLPSDYREVLVLRNLRELPFEEIAKQMGRSAGATRMLWLRALEKLKQLYREDEPARD